MEIKKKCWPEYFEQLLSGKKKFEVRLADFELKEGDILTFEEYNPEIKKYSGRKLSKKIVWFTKFNPIGAWSIEDIKKFGIYEIELA